MDTQAFERYCKREQLKDDMTERIIEYRDTKRRLREHDKRVRNMARGNRYNFPPKFNLDCIDRGEYVDRLRRHDKYDTRYCIEQAQTRARAMGLYVTRWTQLCI